MKRTDARAGFTLVELMIAVSIFAVGSVFVLRSFLSSASALDMLSNRVKALTIAQSRIDTLEEQAVKGELKISARTEEKVAINNRSAFLETEVQELSEIDWPKKELKADVLVRWEEAGREKDVSLACIIKNRK